jgi:hypothetical protein
MNEIKKLHFEKQLLTYWGLLNRGSSLALVLGVAKFIIVAAMILITLCGAT